MQSDVGAVANAVAEITKLVFAELHPSQQELIKERYGQSVQRVNQYRDALLDGDTDTQRRLELGCVFGIPADFGPGQIEQLESQPAEGFNKFNQLGWFQRAEGARFATQVADIVRSTVPTDH